MSKERSSILTQNTQKSKAPIIIAVVAAVALLVAAYFIWLRPSGDTEANGDGDNSSQETTYKSYDDCLMKTHSATNCAKLFYNK